MILLRNYSSARLRNYAQVIVEKSLPLCSYPTYPKYANGPANNASSYNCTAP